MTNDGVAKPIQWIRFYLGCGLGLALGYLWLGFSHVVAGHWLYIVFVFAGLILPIATLYRWRPRTDFRIGLATALAFVFLLAVFLWIWRGGPR